jgi:hypothetical protein
VVILAVDAAHITMCEKNRPRASLTGKRRLFPIMRRVAVSGGFPAGTAGAFFVFLAVYPTVVQAKITTQLFVSYKYCLYALAHPLQVLAYPVYGFSAACKNSGCKNQ